MNAQPASTEPEPSTYDPYAWTPDYGDYGYDNDWALYGYPGLNCRDTHIHHRGYYAPRNGLCPDFYWSY